MYVVGEKDKEKTMTIEAKVIREPDIDGLIKAEEMTCGQIGIICRHSMADLDDFINVPVLMTDCGRLVNLVTGRTWTNIELNEKEEMKIRYLMDDEKIVLSQYHLTTVKPKQ